MSAALAQWHTEHVNFAKLIDVVEAQLDLFHDGATPHYELMQDVMFYLTHYADAVHHPREDLAFARMKAREPRLAPMVDELERQHVELHTMGCELVERLTDILNGSIARRDALETLARDYIATFRHHMNFEESRVLPMAGRLLQDGDWAAIDAQVRGIDDPLFGRDPEPRYAAVERHLESQARV
jgi:hemerythrin-like domain-containing protein